MKPERKYALPAPSTAATTSTKPKRRSRLMYVCSSNVSTSFAARNSWNSLRTIADRRLEDLIKLPDHGSTKRLDTRTQVLTDGCALFDKFPNTLGQLDVVEVIDIREAEPGLSGHAHHVNGLGVVGDR